MRGLCFEYSSAILRVPPETNFGGMASFAHTKAHSLIDAGHRVWVVSRSTSGDDSTTDDGGVTVCRIEAKPFNTFILGRLAWRHCPAAAGVYNYARAVADKVADLHREYGLDLVEAREWGAESVCISPRMNVPVVVRLAYPAFMDRRLYKRRLTFDNWCIERLERKAILSADSLVSPSSQMARIVERESQPASRHHHRHSSPCRLEHLLSGGGRTE